MRQRAWIFRRGSRRLRGHLDEVYDGYVSGWAIDLADPSRELTLDVEVGGRVVATCTTGLERPDVVAALGAGRRPGFSLRFQASGGNVVRGDRVRVRVVDSDSRRTVCTTSITREEWAATHLGTFEAFGGGWLLGWLADLGQPTAPAVGVVSWGTGAQGFVCDVPRAELGASAPGGPPLGFRVRVDCLAAEIARGGNPNITLSAPFHRGLRALAQASLADLYAAQPVSVDPTAEGMLRVSASAAGEPAIMVLRSRDARLPPEVELRGRMPACAVSRSVLAMRIVSRRGSVIPAVLAWLLDEGYADWDDHERRIRDGVQVPVSLAYLAADALRLNLPGAGLSSVLTPDDLQQATESWTEPRQGVPAVTPLQQLYLEQCLPGLDPVGEAGVAQLLAGFLVWLRPLPDGRALIADDQLAWMREVQQSWDGVGLSRYALARQQSRPDWRERFDLGTDHGREGLLGAVAADEITDGYGWLLLGSGPAWDAPGQARGRVKELLRRLVRPESGGRRDRLPAGHVLAGMDASRPALPGRVDKPTSPPIRNPAVEVIGLVSHGSAVGATADKSLTVLKRAGIPVGEVRLDFRCRPVGRELVELRGCGAGVALVHVQPDSLPGVMALGERYFRGFDKIVGVYAWETSVVPEGLLPALELVDEVWTLSKFSARALASATTSPVRVVTPFVDVSSCEPMSRKRWGLGSDAWVVHVSFDAHSTVARKNPLGALRAFQAAFPGDKDVALLLKVRNFSALEWQASAGDRLSRELLTAVHAEPRVVLATDDLDYEHALGMIAGSDCYLSMHRAEGFGYAMAEAMALGVPVVATDYSGSSDFVGPGTAWPVDYDLVPVPPFSYPHWQDGMTWAAPSIGGAAVALREVREGGPFVTARVETASAFIAETLSERQMAVRYRHLLEGHF